MSDFYTKLSENGQHNIWHLNRDGMVDNQHLSRLNEHIEQENAVRSDTHPVEHGLTSQDERILHKILARDYPTETGVGRKRGAILRYIKHFRDEYHTPPKVNGKSLYRYLKRNG